MLLSKPSSTSLLPLEVLAEEFDLVKGGVSSRDRPKAQSTSDTTKAKMSSGDMVEGRKRPKRGERRDCRSNRMLQQIYTASPRSESRSTEYRPASFGLGTHRTLSRHHILVCGHGDNQITSAQRRSCSAPARRSNRSVLPPSRLTDDRSSGERRNGRTCRCLS